MANRKRSFAYLFRFTPEEKDLLESKAAASGLNKTDFIVACLANTPIIVIGGLRETLTELKRQGNNLNQAVKVARELFGNDTQEIERAARDCGLCYQKLFRLWEQADKELKKNRKR